MSKYCDFISGVCSSLGIVSVGESSPLVYMVPSEDGSESKPLLSKTGLPYYLPSFENSKKLTSVDPNTGELLIDKLLFSPVQEDSIKAETMAFTTLKERISYKINIAIYELGHLLLSLVLDDTKIKNLGGDLERFLLDANKGETRGVRKLVDDDTFTRWSKICTKKKTDPNFNPLITIMSVRNGKVEKETYKRLTSIQFPLAEVLATADRSIDNTINGVKLRNKDLSLFDSIFTAICKKLKAKNYVFKVASNNDDYPAFITLYSMYVDVMTAIKSLASKLETLSPEATIFSTPLPYDSESIAEMLDECRKEIDMLPSERSLIIPGRHDKEEVKVASSYEEPGSEVRVRDGVKRSSSSTPQNPYVQPASSGIPTPTSPMEPNVTDKAAAMFSRGSVTGVVPVMTNNAIAMSQNPAMSFISATSGGGYVPPTIGSANAMVVNSGMVPVATGVVATDPYGNSFPAAAVVSPYGQPSLGMPMATPGMINAGINTMPMTTTTPMMTTVGGGIPYGMTTANYSSMPTPDQPTVTRSSKNIYR